MKWIILLAVFWTFALGESIVSINLNKADGQIYALSTDSWLYELDNVAVFQNNKHFLNASAPPFGAGFIKKVYGQKYLFQTLYDINNYGVSLARIDLPFGNKLILNTDETTRSYGYASALTVFDNKDSIALSISNGDRLALFDLNSFQLTQTTKIIAGNKRAATAVVYNHKRNRAIVFWYRFLQSSRTYDMQVLEFNITNSASFYQVASSFPDVGDFNNSRASNAEFDSSNNKIYILDTTSKRIVRFAANNLSVYRFIPLGDVSFELGNPMVAYNFGSQLAHVLSDATTGFKLQEVDLVTGTVRRTRVYSTGLPVATSLLDYQQGNLYVGLLDESTLPAKLLVIDLGNLDHELIPLNH